MPPETQFTACGVRIQLDESQHLNLPFTFSQTDPDTNMVIDPAMHDQPVDIPAGQLRTFAIGLSSGSPLQPTDVRFTFAGDNTFPGPPNPPGPPPLSGVNTLLTSFSTNAVADIVALGATVSKDGIVHIPGPQGSNAFAIAGVNAGRAGAQITVSADTGDAVLPVNIEVCQTDQNALCISPKVLVYSDGPTHNGTTIQMNPGATALFSVYVTATGTICPYFGFNRIFVRFTEDGIPGITRGSMSVAVTTESVPLSETCGGP
jgi:hypothetical protein